MTELQKEFELTGRASWIDSDLYPSRKIYTNGYVEWLEKKIINAPDWSNAPEKANFYAEDENGMGHWYEYRPCRGIAQWLTWGSKWAAINNNWEASLHERPKNPDQ